MIHLITSTERLMFSLRWFVRLFVCQFVCLSICLWIRLRKTFCTDFHEIVWVDAGFVRTNRLDLAPGSFFTFSAWRDRHFYRTSASCCWRAILIYHQFCPSVCPSDVCLSVRDTLVLYENGLTYRHSFFIPVLRASNIFTKFWQGHPLWGR